MRKAAVLAARVDAFCARLNDGLVAIAAILAVLTVAMSIVRAAEVADALSAEWPQAEQGD